MPKSSLSERRRVALAQLQTDHPRLFGKYQQLACLADRYQRCAVIAAHHMGRHIVEVQSEQGRADYGHHAVERLALVLGKSPKTLYRYANIARAWNRKQLRDLCRRKNADGRPLTKSHFIQLAEHQDLTPPQRSELLEAALEQSFTAHQIAKRIDETLGAEQPSELDCLLQRITEIQRELENVSSDLSDHLAHLPMADVHLNVHRRLQRGRDNLCTTKSHVEQTINALQTTLDHQSDLPPEFCHSDKIGPQVETAARLAV